MNKEYFKANEVNGWKLFEQFNNATGIFKEIKNSSVDFENEETTKESIDGTGYSINRLGETKYWNIEIKTRNLNLLDDGRISGCTEKGKVYIEDTVFIESHKVADLLLDKINGLTPLYINFLSDGHIIIYNLDNLRYRPKKSGNLNIKSKGYGKFEMAKRQGLYIEDAAIYDSNYNLIKKAGEKWNNRQTNI